MSPKFRINNFAKAKKIKRFVSSYQMTSGKITSGATTTKAVARIVTREEFGRIKNYRCIAKGVQGIQDVREGDLVYVIELMEKAHKTMRDIRADNRKEAIRNGGGGGGDKPYNGIFHRLVDENKLADCIIQIMRHFFQGEKECKICNKDFNIYGFFLLLHFYFGYIHILENTKQLPFCGFLKDKVFAGEDRVNVRNFNIYANKDSYANFAQLLSKNKYINFNSRPMLPREKSENFLLAPFQEIGWNFHNSPYFVELRREREKVNQFIL